MALVRGRGQAFDPSNLVRGPTYPIDLAHELAQLHHFLLDRQAVLSESSDAGLRRLAEVRPPAPRQERA